MVEVQYFSLEIVADVPSYPGMFPIYQRFHPVEHGFDNVWVDSLVECIHQVEEVRSVS